MQNRFIALFAVLALSGCDNPEAPQITASTNPTPAATSSGTGTATTAPTSSTVDPRRDTSPTKTTEMALKDFDSVNANGGAEVHIEVGQPYKVTVECTENSAGGLKVAAEGTTLNVTTDRGFNASVAKVIISTPKLANVTSNGTMLVKIKSAAGDNLHVTTNGLSTIEGSGAVQHVVATGADSSLIRLVDLQAQTADVSTTGKCVAELTVKETATAKGSGDSIITIKGKPKGVSKEKHDRSMINVN